MVQFSAILRLIIHTIFVSIFNLFTEKVVYLFGVFFIASSSFLNAQETKEIKSYKLLSLKEGLTENRVKETIVDAQNGYWFRTDRSIIFFNGHEFSVFDSYSLFFRMSNKSINEMSLYKNKIIVYGESGIEEIDCVSKKVKTLYKDTLGFNFLGGIITTYNKHLVVSKKGDIYNIKQDSLEKIGKIEMYSELICHETKEGHVLVSNGSRTMIAFSASLKQLRKINLPPSRVFSGGIHLYPGKGTIIMIYKEVFLYVPRTASLQITDFPISPRRKFHQNGKHNYVISRFNDIQQQSLITNTVTQLKIKSDLNFYINDITSDNDKNIVLSTNQGVILFKEPVSFTSNIEKTLTHEEYESKTRRALLETDDGSILQLNYKQINSYNPKTGINKVKSKNNIDSYAGLLNRRNLWIGVDGAGLVKYDLDKNRFSKTIGYDNYIKGFYSNVSSLVQYDANRLLFGEILNGPSTLKLYDIRKDSYQPYLIKGLESKYLHKKISAIIPVPNNGWWICSDQGLFRINKNDSLLFALGKADISTDSINHVYEDGSLLWIATNKGVIQYDKLKRKQLKIYNSSIGLAGDKCIAILPDKYATIWIPTYTGLSRIDKISSKIFNYHIADGMMDDEYNYASYLLAKSGDIYLGGLNGYIRITPEPIGNDFSRNVNLYFDYAIKFANQNINNGELLEENQLQFHRSKERLELSFSLRKPIDAEYIRYYYRILGLNDQWIPLNRQDKINISFLPTGKYTLEIKALFLNNHFNHSVLKLPLEAYVYWFESKVFYFLLTSSILIFIIYFLYYRYKAKIDLSKIRTDLANDIHDEIGTQLTKSLLKLEILRHKELQLSEELKKVEIGLREVIQSFRNMLWTLNTDNIYTDDFISRVQNMLIDIFEDTGFEISVTNLSSDKFFIKSIRVRRNLLLIIKELSNNTLKHSNGNIFELVISQDGKYWTILLADNGKNSNDTIQSNKGLGLKSVERRVKAIGGLLSIQKESNGFFVKIKL